jgi:hypothetical protein
LVEEFLGKAMAMQILGDSLLMYNAKFGQQ